MDVLSSKRTRPMTSILLVPLILVLLSAALAADVSRKDKIKAALVYNLGKSFQWPGSPATAFTIAVWGDDPLFDALRGAEGRTVNGRPLTVIKANDIAEARKAEILFVGAAAAPQLTTMLRELSGAPVLTASDLDGFCQKGGCVGLVESRNRFRFQVNPAALEKSKLKPDPGFMKLATAVK